MSRDVDDKEIHELKLKSFNWSSRDRASSETFN